MANTLNNNSQFQSFGQNTMAQFLPQPQGNVYLINSSNDLGLIPVGTIGVSVAICFAEGVMFLKTMQNNNPMLLRYKLNSLDTPFSNTSAEQVPQNNSNNTDNKIISILKNYDERLLNLEKIVNNPIPTNNTNNTKNGGAKEWPI